MFHALRIIASFALLGAVLAGVAFGWSHWNVDPSIFGAIGGAAFGLFTVIHGRQTDPVYASL